MLLLTKLIEHNFILIYSGKSLKVYKFNFYFSLYLYFIRFDLPKLEE